MFYGATKFKAVAKSLLDEAAAVRRLLDEASEDVKNEGWTCSS